MTKISLSGFIFRKANAEDQLQLMQVGIAAYSQYKNVLEKEHWEKLNSFLNDAEKLSQLLNNSTCFVAEHNKQIVGMAYIVNSGNPWDVFQAEWSYLRIVGVIPEYSGKGIAKQLIQLCIEHAKKTGEKTIALHTGEFMNSARHIYVQLGFKQYKEIEPRLGKKYWLYLMNII